MQGPGIIGRALGAGTRRRPLARAQSIVELSIAVPLLMSLLFLSVNASAIYRTTMVAQSAAAETARYFASKPSASDAELEAFARSTGDLGTSATVTISPVDVADQTYTMRVTDATGTLRTARAKTIRKSVRVTVKVPVTLVGVATPFTAEGQHTGVVSIEGEAA